ncbi:DNA recombination protein RmuC [Candidatus Ruminimicrobium bovinum]|uniref:DNA recombination protein RmuC n=1 Tax=Candidatus Ruminimicrobium bovinum TaxID=3242779 RepID=UPI0039B92C4D
MLWLLVCLIIILVAVSAIFIIKFFDIKKLYVTQQLRADSLAEKEAVFLKESGKLEQLNFVLKEKDSIILKNQEIISAQQKQINLLEREKLSINKDKEYVEKEKENLQQLQKTLLTNSKTEFQTVANEILKLTKTELNSINKEELKNVVMPFEKNIKSFEETIQKQTKEFSQTKGSLENELKNVINQGNQLKEQTSNLIDMFKTDSKAKGDFGETILQTILENSNLQKDVNYFVQQQEQNKRTDFQIKLPGDKWIVIDSKVPLNAYIQYCNCTNETDKNKFLDEHVKTIKNFISDLSGKKYYERFDKNSKTISPDFTMMFVYPEEAYIAALRHNPSLTNAAWSKDIAIVSATSLIHTIKIIEKLWDVHRQVQNHEKIISMAKNFKIRLASFVENMAKLSNNIVTVNKTFNDFQKTVKGDRGLEKIVSDLSSYGINSSDNKLDTQTIKEII